MCATGGRGQGACLPGPCALPRLPPISGSPVLGRGADSLPCPTVLRGNQNLSNQVIFRPFPERTSIKVPRRNARGPRARVPQGLCPQQVAPHSVETGNERGLSFLGQGFFRDSPQNKATGIHKVLTMHFLGGLIAGTQEEGTHCLCPRWGVLRQRPPTSRLRTSTGPGLLGTGRQSRR